MPKESNIYDLVEREAARSGIPRIELWQSVAKALVEGRLVLSEIPNLSIPFIDWLVGFKAAVDRHNDPNTCARTLKQIVVRLSVFKRWRQRDASPGRRGPRRNTTGYQASDRELFPEIDKRIRTGKARSARDAALQLFKEKKISGNSPESAAKRVSSRFRKEYAT